MNLQKFSQLKFFYPSCINLLKDSKINFGLGGIGGIFESSCIFILFTLELSKFEKREIEAKMEKKYTERFQFPLGLAAILLVIETCLTTRKKQFTGKDFS